MARALGAVAMGVAALGFAPAAHAAEASFAPALASPFAVGYLPVSVAVGDFNQDGRPDLATANFGNDNVTVLLGDGAGGFSVPTNPSTTGAGPISVAVGDFNHDGRLDLATANSGDNTITVLLGDGTGGFSAPTNSTPITTSGSPYSVAVGDFNHDDKPDLATVDVDSDDVTVLLGDGTGGFSAPTNPTPNTTGVAPTSVAVGDFNQDGRLDLATANALGLDNITVLLGDGTGRFSAPTNSTPITTGASPRSVAVADFNHDDKPDLATANADSDDVTVLLGDGAGRFSAPANPTPNTAGESPRSVAVGDFNHDDKPDLATANYDSNDVTVLLGDGTGGLSAPTPFTAGNRPDAVAVGDFNHDDKPDLATAAYYSNGVTVLLNTTPTPPPAEFVPASGPAPPSLSVERQTPPIEPARDTLAPAITAAKLSSTRFAVDAGAKASATKATRGTRLALRLSEPSTVVFVTEQRAGRRWRKLRIFGQRLPAGKSTIDYSGKIRPRGKQRALRPGRYRLRMRPSDRAGNKGKLTTLSFTIVKR